MHIILFLSLLFSFPINGMQLPDTPPTHEHIEAHSNGSHIVIDIEKPASSDDLRRSHPININTGSVIVSSHTEPLDNASVVAHAAVDEESQKNGRNNLKLKLALVGAVTTVCSAGITAAITLSTTLTSCDK